VNPCRAYLFALAACAVSGACAGAATPSAPAPTSAPVPPRVVDVSDDTSTIAQVVPPDGATDADASDDALAANDGSAASPAWTPPPGSVDAATLVASDFGLGRLVASSAVLLVNVARIRASAHAPSVGAAAEAMARVQPFSKHDLGIDWALVRGNSLIRTERDVAILRCDADDGAIDAALGARPRVDGVQRALVHVQPHVVALVPPDLASSAARALSSATFPPGIAGPELVALRLDHPPQGPNGWLPAHLDQLRFRVLAAPNDAADLILEEDAPTPALAAKIGSTLSATISSQNTFMVRLVTHGLLDHCDVGSDGRTTTARVQASRDQIDAILHLIEALSRG
jgi:hypothetical protein